MRGPDERLRKRARHLRADSTNAEMVLWLALRDRRLGGFKFTRQISVGPYIADFVCRERKLIIEVDGGQHADSLSDRYRDEYIKRLGYRILRFWNSDVLTNKDGVLAVIKGELIASGT